MEGSGGATLIGFGEAGRAFAVAGRWGEQVRAFDRLTNVPDARASKRADYAAAGVAGCLSVQEAIAGADIILSVVTADQALEAAHEACAYLAPGCIYCDLNSVAPATKREAARAVEGAGAGYVDVAVMSPVQPAALAVPLLLSGGPAADAAEALRGLGFTNIRVVGAEVGRASSIKMIRSVMIKGLEALTAECVSAAGLAGVLDEVLASLDASWTDADWTGRSDYNLDRMMVHGRRRAAEMEEVVRTLNDLGVDPVMSRAAAERQASLGALELRPPPDGLNAKLTAILAPRARAA
jgi:3-hydroxyisobutyrate dehydrogenase-like beta-hydroxyacid dehydrogenase